MKATTKPLTRREFLMRAVVAVTGSAAGCVCVDSRGTRAGRKPNILLIMTDQEPVSAIGCYGNRAVKTPAQDAIADGGVRFNNYYTAAYPCSPSRATMITGRYAHNHGVTGNGMPIMPGVPGLGDALTAAGYDTAWVGKAHLPGNEIPVGGFNRCVGHGPYHEFLEREGLLDLVRRRSGERLPGIGAPEIASSTFDDVHAYSLLDEEHHLSHFLADRALAELEQMAQEERPFCLVLSFHGPHWPVAPPKPWDTMYGLDDVELPPNFNIDISTKPIFQRAVDLNFVRPYWTEEQFRDYICRYYGYVSYIDGQIQRVLDTLEAKGLEDNTIVAFTSDHGDMCGEQGMVNKLVVNGYDALMKVPFLLRWPGHIPKGLVDDGLASSVDLMPTLLDLAGVESPDGMDGHSMKSRVLGEGGAPRDAVFTDVYAKGFMVREGAWKFVLNGEYKGRKSRRDLSELYDMATDPHETMNLILDPAYQEQAGTMEESLLTWLEETGHPDAQGYRLLAAQSPIETQPLFPLVTNFEDLGGGRFRFSYVWNCAREFTPPEGAVDFALLSAGQDSRSGNLWASEWKTKVESAPWEPGHTATATIEGEISGEINTGLHTLYVGMRAANGPLSLMSGIGAKPVVKLKISNTGKDPKIEAILYRE